MSASDSSSRPARRIDGASIEAGVMSGVTAGINDYDDAIHRDNTVEMRCVGIYSRVEHLLLQIGDTLRQGHGAIRAPRIPVRTESTCSSC
jgi:hypothetical protein